MNRITMATVSVLVFIFAAWMTDILAIIMWGIIIVAAAITFISMYFFIQLKRAELKSAMYDAKAKKYLSYKDGLGMFHLVNIKTDRVENLTTYPGSHHNGTWEKPPDEAMQAWQMVLNATAKRGIKEQLLPSPEQQQKQLPNLLDILDKSDRVLIKGPTDSGKSTLLVSIIKRIDGAVVVIDPHYEPGYWPEKCKIIGKGRNHEQISEFFEWVSKELDRRYQLRARDIRNYKPLTIIIDEWMSISKQCPNATNVITEMITESRKVKMRVFIGSHSDQVEALGIKGMGKLREALVIVRLYYDQVTENRHQTFDYGRGERECSLYEPAGQMVIESQDDKFVRVYQQTGSKSEACRQAYGRDYAGNLVGKCKILLGER